MADEPLLSVTWTDPQTGAHGYCVIDRLVGDIATGGTRMRDGCTLDEVAALARGMSAKAGTFGLPVGGAKGGIDCDPRHPEARDILTRFVQAMRPLLNEYWVTAEDLGVRQSMLDEVFDAAGMGMSLHAAIARSPDPAATLKRVREAFVVEVDGLALPDVIGGFGVAEAAAQALRALGRDPAQSRAAVQGFGSMGGSAARYLAGHGVSVVAVADRQGVVVDESGLDIEAMLRARTPQGDVDRDRLDGVRELPGSSWLGLDVDVVVPAAVSYAITTANCGQITADLVVPAANVPASPEAEQMLLDRGVTVVPDFVANGGAAAWAWWTLFGDIGPDPADAFAKLSETMRTIVSDVLDVSRQDGVSPREAALTLARATLDRFDADLAVGASPKPIR